MPLMPDRVVLDALPESLPKPTPVPEGVSLPSKLVALPKLTLSLLALYSALFWMSLVLSVPPVSKRFLFSATALSVLAIAAPVRSVWPLTSTSKPQLHLEGHQSSALVWAFPFQLLTGILSTYRYDGLGICGTNAVSGRIDVTPLCMKHHVDRLPLRINRCHGVVPSRGDTTTEENSHAKN